MVDLLLLKQLGNLSDKDVVVRYKHDPYHQIFCGLIEFSREIPCHSTGLVKFRNRIGNERIKKIFSVSVVLYSKQALRGMVNIIYPSDVKLSIMVINRLNKLVKSLSIQKKSL